MKKCVSSRFIRTALAAILATMLVSCDEDVPPPVVEIFSEADSSDPLTILFTTISENAISFSWEFGDGQTGTGNSPSHTYDGPGDYIVNVAATGAGGEAVDSENISISELPPVVEIISEEDAYDPFTYHFTTTSENAMSFAWDFGDGTTGTGDAVDHTYEVHGDYTVTVTATGSGGEAVDSENISITALPPVVEISSEVDASDPYTFHFTTTSENATSFAWDFGDGTTGTGDAVDHTYSVSGDYFVSVTATGEGGNSIAHDTVNIPPSMEELLSGGAAATNGKTWVLSRTSTPGFDGAGTVNPDFSNNIALFVDNLLDLYGFAEEYDNEYTFFHDGSYAINNVNGNHLAGWVFAVANVPQEDWITISNSGVFVVRSSPPINAIWTITEDANLVVDAVDEGVDGPNIEKTVVFDDANYISFGGGGFIGLQDFTAEVIIRDLTQERMVLSIFTHQVEAVPLKPSQIYTLSFDAK